MSYISDVNDYFKIRKKYSAEKIEIEIKRYFGVEQIEEINFNGVITDSKKLYEICEKKGIKIYELIKVIKK